MNKAFMIFSGSPSDGCLLVFAENRNKAKFLAVGSNFDWEYRDMNTRREPDYDKYATKELRIEDNSELPDGAPSFFWEETYDD